MIIVQGLLFSTIGLEITGLRVLFLRQVTGFALLFIIPGTALLSILKIGKLRKTELVLFSTGLSIAFVMFTVIITSLLGSSLGFSSPISPLPITLVLTVATDILCIVALKRRGQFGRFYVDWSFRRSEMVPLLFLLSLPILSILGAYSVNFQDNNSLLLVMLALLSVVPVFASFDIIPERLHPLAVMSVAVSLLFHSSLISANLVEYGDTSWEYYFARIVLLNQHWNPNIFGNFNAIPSVVILGPVASEVCDLSLTWVFKLVFPLIFSLVPLGIYCVTQRQTNSKIAFLSSFFFMSMFSFFTTSLGTARFEVAALFLVLVLLTIVSNRMNGFLKTTLCVVFSAFLVISHYALSSLFLLVVTGALVIKFVAARREKQSIVVNFIFLASYSAIILSWFLFIAGGSVFATLVSIGSNIVRVLGQPSALTKTPVSEVILSGTERPLSQFAKGLQIITQLFIAVGILAAFALKDRKFVKEYLYLSLATFAVCFAALLVPNLASTVGSSRLYFYGLLFLSPFCIVGGQVAIGKLGDLAKRIAGRRLANKSAARTLQVLAVFFAIYLLFNSGFIYELAGEPNSFALDSASVWRPHFNEQEMSAGNWLTIYRNPNNQMLADLTYAHLLMMSLGVFNPLEGNENVTTVIHSGAYVFLGSENTRDGIIRLSDPANPRLNYTVVPMADLNIYSVLLNSNKIYDSGDAQIFEVPPNIP